MKDVQVRHAAEVLDEIEANAANSPLVQALQFAVGHRIGNAGHSAIGIAARRDGIQGYIHLGAVAARMHDHGARDAELGVQFPQIFDRRVGRCVAAVRGIWKFARRTKHMAVGIACAGRQTQRGCDRSRIRGQATFERIFCLRTHLRDSRGRAASSAKYLRPALASGSRMPYRSRPNSPAARRLRVAASFASRAAAAAATAAACILGTITTPSSSPTTTSPGCTSIPAQMMGMLTEPTVAFTVPLA